MASVTQTIPQFSLGMSEQPDNLKFPGQVTDIVNAIPDVTKGLFKRPGAKRVGTSPLANVHHDGAWFHYYRDESEGSYIGQVDHNGAVRMWKASGDNAGAEQTIVYGTGGQTAIQNYLATNDPENLQFLTINDTTFVNSRDSSNSNTLVGQTGSSQAPPDNHFAMLELLRTENGRQYGLDIFRTADVTGISRATRISITDDTLYEGDGSGSCPGIGTQVFAVTGASSYSNVTTVSVQDSSSNNLGDAARTATINGNSRNIGAPKNLIFRINALGQQGVSPNYSCLLYTSPSPRD